MTSAEHTERLREDGFTIVPGVLSGALADELCAISLASKRLWVKCRQRTRSRAFTPCARSLGRALARRGEEGHEALQQDPHDAVVEHDAHLLAIALDQEPFPKFHVAHPDGG